MQYDQPYPESKAMPRDPDPDPRIVAMHRVVDLEQAAYEHERASEQAQKRAAISREELAQARRELHDLLGVSGNDGAPAGAVLR